MNKFIIITAMLFLSFKGFAQSEQVEIKKAEVFCCPIPQRVEIKYRSWLMVGAFSAQVGYYVESGSYVFNSDRITALPQRNINAIAGTIAGVVSIDGNIPNIKGARADGTAYFIDGVRVYQPVELEELAVRPIKSAY